MRYYRVYISSLYSLDRRLLLTLIVTDKVYSRNSRPHLFVYIRFYYCLSTSNSNRDFRLRGCSPKFILSDAITIWLIHAKYWSHRRPNICSSFLKIILKVVLTLLLDWDCLLDIDYGVHEFTPDVLVVRVIALFQFSGLSFYELCLAMLFLFFTIVLSFYIDLLLLVTSWYSLNSFYIQI